jgi:UDP-N-acetylglucosamine 4,6-dehydratase
MASGCKADWRAAGAQPRALQKRENSSLGRHLQSCIAPRKPARFFDGQSKGYSDIMLNNKSVLITGGTGSFGKAFVKRVLEQYPDVRRLVIYSRDELKQFEMQQVFPREKYPAIRYFIGDVRDEARLRRALEGIDIVVHAAALKQVPAAEYNPFECIKTNVLGAQNLIEACLDSKVERLVALSTDKAAAPINLYGATKLCSDKLFVAANSIQGSRGIRFSVVRYGNVMGSRGSVIPFFMARKSAGVLPITDERMTRFNISLQEGVEMVLWSIANAEGGEVLVPKIPSYRITDVATAVAPECRQEIVGIRPGEKIHEEMITASDSFNTVDLGHFYAILPTSGLYSVEEYCGRNSGKPVEPGFSYNSGDNPDFLTVDELRGLIERHVVGQVID